MSLHFNEKGISISHDEYHRQYETIQKKWNIINGTIYWYIGDDPLIIASNTENIISKKELSKVDTYVDTYVATCERIQQKLAEKSLKAPTLMEELLRSLLKNFKQVDLTTLEYLERNLTEFFEKFDEMLEQYNTWSNDEFISHLNQLCVIDEVLVKKLGKPFVNDKKAVQKAVVIGDNFHEKLYENLMEILKKLRNSKKLHESLVEILTQKIIGNFEILDEILSNYGTCMGYGYSIIEGEPKYSYDR
jgi:hypothetical protein